MYREENEQIANPLSAEAIRWAPLHASERWGGDGYSYIGDFGPWPGTNEHPRRDADVRT